MKWISVDKRLPEGDMWVLLCYQNTTQWCTARLDFDGTGWEWFDLDADHLPVHSATHWMPLPEPPEAA